VLSGAALIASRIPASVEFELSIAILKLLLPRETVRVPVPTTLVAPLAKGFDEDLLRQIVGQCMIAAGEPQEEAAQG